MWAGTRSERTLTALPVRTWPCSNGKLLKGWSKGVDWFKEAQCCSVEGRSFKTEQNRSYIEAHLCPVLAVGRLQHNVWGWKWTRQEPKHTEKQLIPHRVEVTRLRCPPGSPAFPHMRRLSCSRLGVCMNCARTVLHSRVMINVHLGDKFSQQHFKSILIGSNDSRPTASQGRKKREAPSLLPTQVSSCVRRPSKASSCCACLRGADAGSNKAPRVIELGSESPPSRVPWMCAGDTEMLLSSPESPGTPVEKTRTERRGRVKSPLYTH